MVILLTNFSCSLVILSKKRSHEDFTQTIHPEAVRSGEPGHPQKCLMNLFILGSGS